MMSWLETLPYLVLLAGMATMPVLLSRELSRNVFHPLSYQIFQDFTTIVAPAFFIAVVVRDPGVMNSLPEAVLLIGGSFLMIWLGYSLSLGRTIAHKIPLVAFRGGPANIPWFRLLILYILGWFGRLMALRSGFTHQPNAEMMQQIGELGLWRDISLFAVLSYLLICYHIFRAARDNKSPLLYGGLILFLGLEVFSGALYGGRTAIVLPVLQLLFAYSISTQRPIRWATLFAGYIVALVFLGPLLTQYRNAFYDVNDPGRGGISAGLSTLYSVERADEYGPFAEQAIIVLGQRAGTFESVLRVLDRVPSVVEYQDGNTFVPVLADAFIPRVIWPDKPVFLTGRYFAVMFWDAPGDYREVGTSVGITMPAELYLNFGWLGVIGIILFGIMLRFLHEREMLYAIVEKGISVVRRYYVIFIMGFMSGMISGYVVGGIRSWILFMVFLTLLQLQMPRIVRVGRALSFHPGSRQRFGDEFLRP